MWGGKIYAKPLFGVIFFLCSFNTAAAPSQTLRVCYLSSSIDWWANFWLSRYGYTHSNGNQAKLIEIMHFMVNPTKAIKHWIYFWLEWVLTDYLHGSMMIYQRCASSSGFKVTGMYSEWVFDLIFFSMEQNLVIEMISQNFNGHSNESILHTLQYPDEG